MSKLYLRTRPHNFNQEAELLNKPFRWKDQNNDNFLDFGEIVFDQNYSIHTGPRYFKYDGSYTPLLYKEIVEIDSKAFLQSRFVYHLILDKGIDGNPENNIPIEDCDEYPPISASVDECKQLVRNSVEADSEKLVSGKSQGGDLHGLIALFPRLSELGIHTVYSTSYLRQSRVVGRGYSPVSHGYNPSDLGACSLSPFLADSEMHDCDFIRYVYEEATKYGIGYIVDYPFMGTQPFDDGVFNKDLVMMDTQYVFKDGKIIADANRERRELGLKAGEFDKEWRTRSRPDFFFSHADDVNFSTTKLSVDPEDELYYLKLQTHTFFGLRRPNLEKGSVACNTYMDYFFEHPAFELLKGFRGDAAHYADDSKCGRDIVASARHMSSQNVHVSAECMGAGETYDYSARCAKSYLLNNDPDKRTEVFFFGARTAMEKVFTNEREPLNALSAIPDVYERFGFDPRILSGYIMFPDNHDKPMLMDLTSGEGPIRRMTHTDLSSAFLFAGASPASIYVYYPTLALARDRNEDHLKSSIMGHRPKLNLMTETDESSFNILERTIKFMYDFSEEHYSAMGYGTYEPGLVSGFDNKSFWPWSKATVHAVKRKFFDDEIAVVTMRSLNSDGRPEDELRNVRLNLSAGKWRDALTGQTFDINADGEISFIVGDGKDLTMGIDIHFNERGYKFYKDSRYCRPNISGVDMCYNISGVSAELPDGRWMPVNPEKDETCDPYFVYKKYASTTSDIRYSEKHPYEGCPTYITSHGKVSAVQVADSEKSKISLRRVAGKNVLPDGQYFLDRAGSECDSWVNTKDTEGSHESEVCGSMQDEIVWIKDGRVRLMPSTRVMYLEKIN